MNQLDQLKQYTTVVADTADFTQLARYAPRDATTNPSLILKAVQQPDGMPLLAQTVARHRDRKLADIVDELLVGFGVEILRAIPGRVSTEVDARLSFDTAATVARGRHLIALYEAAGIPRRRVLIKIASTWEGIEAARMLEREGIHCNLTLLFSLCQAVACADAGVQLVSPFVGRIHDWHKKAAGAAWNDAAHAGADDPGVQSVRSIYTYYKHFGVATQVMGASFRNVGQVAALAGCDLLTIGTDVLAQLQAGHEPLARQLDPRAAHDAQLRSVHYTEATFRQALNDDAMATEKLAEGVRLFAADAAQLDRMIKPW